MFPARRPSPWEQALGQECQRRDSLSEKLWEVSQELPKGFRAGPCGEALAGQGHPGVRVGGLERSQRPGWQATPPAQPPLSCKGWGAAGRGVTSKDVSGGICQTEWRLEAGGWRGRPLLVQWLSSA